MFGIGYGIYLLNRENQVQECDATAVTYLYNCQAHKTKKAPNLPL